MAIADLPYLHAAGDGGPRSSTRVVVIHATDNTASASGEASYATRRADQTSAHFYVDDGSAYRALPLDNIAYGCLWHGNQISVQFELCGRSNQISDATMRRAAPLVAEICARYGLPIRKLSAGEVAAGATGICGHAEITAAFPQDNGDHTDPGNAFPWSTFIGYVQAAANPTPEVPDVNLSDGFNIPTWGDPEFKAAEATTVENALACAQRRSYQAWQAAVGARIDIKALAAKVNQPAPVTMTDADRAAIADLVVAKLAPTLPTAAQVAEELAKRLGNG